MDIARPTLRQCCGYHLKGTRVSLGCDARYKIQSLCIVGYVIVFEASHEYCRERNKRDR